MFKSITLIGVLLTGVVPTPAIALTVHTSLPQCATPVETNCVVTLHGAPPSSITYVITIKDSTPGAIIHFTVYDYGNVSYSGSGAATLTITDNDSNLCSNPLVGCNIGALTGKMYATAPGYTQSSTTGMSF